MKNALAIAAVVLALLPIANTSADPVEDGIYLKVSEGTLVRAADDARVFMVDRGVLRHITGNAFERLYRNFGVVTTIVEIPEHLVGEPVLPPPAHVDARRARRTSGSSRTAKRSVTSPTSR